MQSRTWRRLAGWWNTNTPGLAQLGGVWLPLPHLLMLPFIGRMEWWQDGMAGAWPALICYVLAVMGLYRLARRMLTPPWAMVATAFFGLNANLLYLATTPMTEPLFLALFVWIALKTMEFVDAVRAAAARTVTGNMLMLGALILAGTMTRYDGWVLGRGGVGHRDMAALEGAGPAATGDAGVCGVYTARGAGADSVALVQPRV